MRKYGCSYDQDVAMTDANFLKMCTSSGLGIKKSQIDQGQLYTGEKVAHDIKHRLLFFLKGRMTL